MKQMTLFDVMDDTKKKKNNSDPSQTGGMEVEKMTPCVMCKVLPIVRHRMLEGHGYNYAKCPICGWSCGTPYNIVDQWNKLNTLDFRLREKNRKG